MKNIISRTAIFAFGCFFIAGMNMALAGLPEAAKDCTSCHNDDGISDDQEVPIIAGASDFFLENQLAIFEAGARPCEDDYFEQDDEVDAENHCTIAEALSDDDKAEIAAYFSSKPFSAAVQEVDEELAAKGESIHKANCDKCHSDAGSLALDDAGILAGQWKHYLIEQFKYYKAGERWQPEKMEPEMDLSDEEMKALAEFYAREGL